MNQLTGDSKQHCIASPCDPVQSHSAARTHSSADFVSAHRHVQTGQPPGQPKQRQKCLPRQNWLCAKPQRPLDLAQSWDNCGWQPLEHTSSTHSSSKDREGSAPHSGGPVPSRNGH